MKKIQTFIFISLFLLAGCSSSGSNESKITLEQKQGTEMIKIDDLNLRYRKTGNGQAMLLIHHVRGQLEYFHKIEPTLAKKYTVYAIDLPGHGKSDIPAVDYTAQYQLQILKKFIQTLQLKNLIIVGESIGGSLALGLAADKELTVDKVIALNAFNGEHGIAEGNTFAKVFVTLLTTPGIGNLLSKRSSRGATKRVLSGGFSDPKKLDDALIDLYVNTAKREGFGTAGRSFLIKRNSYATLADSFANITSPVLSIHGKDDWRPASERKSYVAKVANVTHVVLPKTGHFSSQESPELVLQNIERFLQ